MTQTTTSITELAKETERTAHLSENERHVLLSAKRRRLVLDVLSDLTSPVEIDELAAEVAKREDGLDADDDGDRKGVAITLFHRHLPKMDDFGVLDFDPDRQRVTL